MSDRPSPRRPSRQAWLALLVGLPLLGFSILFIHAYQVVNAMAMSMSFVLLYAATLRKKNAGIRFTRATLVGFVACFFTIGALTENPALWASQVHRKAFKATALLQPDSPAIAELETAFYWWLDNTSSNFANRVTFYGANLSDTSKPMEDEYHNRQDRTILHASLSAWEFANGTIFDDVHKLMIVDRFIRWHVMTWTDDTTTRGVSDHVPDPAEALDRWSFSEAWRANTTNPALQAWDDCDGIAVVTASFLRRLESAGTFGGKAYIASGRRHWFTGVVLNESAPVVFVYHWKEIHVYGIYMDDGTIAYGQNLLKTLLDVVIIDMEDRDEMLSYLDLVMQDLAWLVPIAAVLVAMLAVAFFGYPRDYEIGKERARVAVAMERYRGKPAIVRALAWLFPVKIGNPFGRRHALFWLTAGAVAGLLAAAVFLLYHAILLTTAFSYATVFIFASLLAILLVLDRDVPARLFMTGYHLVTGKAFTLHPRVP